MRILVVRLGAMGDVIHALPAVAALKRTIANAWIAWAVEPRWAPLLEGNPDVDRVVRVNRKQWTSVKCAWRELRAMELDCAVDFQGLIKSALVTKVSGARRRAGYSADQVRERPAAWLYTETFPASAPHIVDRHRELAQAVGARPLAAEFPIPVGTPEGSLPDRYVLANPFAGWPSKQWPLPFYTRLAKLLPMPLVLNGHPGSSAQLQSVDRVQVHISSIAGLIDATRRATAVVGLDSGPTHLAAALAKPGVAIFGPTDPARNGPYGGSLRVLRAAGAVTSYQRRQQVDPSMLAITPEQVAEALAL
ncbi:MAG: glycosyltransferase family 9 protein [Acidobacteria bacterium]|nr:glycosyltransferase family 9 protein [Acidobacteriota bacterium]